MCDETRKRDAWSPMYACFNDFTTYTLTSAQASVKPSFNEGKGSELSSSFQKGLNNRAKATEKMIHSAHQSYKRLKVCMHRLLK